MPKNDTKVTIFRGLLEPNEPITAFDWWKEVQELVAPPDKNMYIEIQAVPQKDQPQPLNPPP